MTIAKKVELVVEGYICSMSGRERDFVYPRDISNLCMFFLSNIFSNCQYILISNNENPIIYGTSLKVISESKTKEIKTLKGDYVLNGISAQHPEIKTSQLIGLDLHRIRTYNYETQDAVQLGNSFFVHHVENKPNNMRYIPLEFVVKHFFETEPMGYPLLVSFDMKQEKITNKELHQKIFSAISHVIKEGKHEDDAFGMKAVLFHEKNKMDIENNDTVFPVDLCNVLKINVAAKSKLLIRDFFRNWSVFNCQRDAISAPIQEFMAVSYKLVGRDAGFGDRKIDINMTVGNFKNYIARKHPKWIGDGDNGDIVLTDHVGIADHKLLSLAGTEPIRLRVEQRDDCLIQ